MILSHIDFEIHGTEKIAVVGRNGAGKTTLLRLIAGELELDRDDKRQGLGVRSSRQATVGLLRQQVFTEAHGTVEEEILSACPAEELFSRERFSYQREYETLFTGFGFSKADRSRKLSSFSGGEQTKIALIRLLLQKPDILLLDEPTNDLDIQTLSVLEDYLDSFPGAVVAVSHDRYFLDRVVRRVFAVEGDGSVRGYPGGYTEYLEARRAAGQPARSPKPAEPKAARPQGAKKLKFSYKEQREFETIDADIAALEAELAQVQAEQEEKATDYVALQSLQERQAELEAALEEEMERWVYLNDLAEQISNQ